MRLAALGLSYAQAGRLVGSVKSTLCRWVRREAVREPMLSGRVWELDGMWTRTRSGPREMRVIRDEMGTALGSFQPWEEVIDQAWRQAEGTPVHLVSDDDRAIAAGIGLVYGGRRPTSSASSTCCRNTGGTWAIRDSGQQGHYWDRPAGPRPKNTPGRRLYAAEARPWTGAVKHWEKVLPIWGRGRRNTGPHLGWSARTGNTADEKRWELSGRRTTCWHCYKSGAS